MHDVVPASAGAVCMVLLALTSACGGDGDVQGAAEDGRDAAVAEAASVVPQGDAGATGSRDAGVTDSHDTGATGSRDAGAGPAVDPADASSPGTAGGADVGIDAGGSSPMPADAALPRADAAAVSCALDAGAASACVAHLCSADAGTFLVLEDDERWYVGGLDWVASLCDRPLGFPASRTSDNARLLFGLTLRDVDEVEAGAQVLVYWGSPDSPPSSAGGQVQACSFEAAAPLPACPDTPFPPVHRSLRGCRGPLDPGCEACRDLEGGYRSAGTGADTYNISSSMRPTSCTGECPGCASCLYRSEELARDLQARPECEPCPADPGVDPCFDPSGCACWCVNRASLRDACPTLVH